MKLTISSHDARFDAWVWVCASIVVDVCVQLHAMICKTKQTLATAIPSDRVRAFHWNTIYTLCVLRSAKCWATHWLVAARWTHELWIRIARFCIFLTFYHYYFFPSLLFVSLLVENGFWCFRRAVSRLCLAVYYACLTAHKHTRYPIESFVSIVNKIVRLFICASKCIYRNAHE